MHSMRILSTMGTMTEMTSTRELRCGHKLHGVYYPETHELEVRCQSRYCGYEKGVVVEHRIRLDTGDIVTKRYKEPPRPTST